MPVIVDNLCYGHEWAAKWGPLVIADILGREALNVAMGRYQRAGVTHFAAFTSDFLIPSLLATATEAPLRLPLQSDGSR